MDHTNAYYCRMGILGSNCQQLSGFILIMTIRNSTEYVESLKREFEFDFCKFLA